MRISNIHHIIVAEESPIIRDGLLQVLCHITNIHVHAVAVATLHSLDDMLRMRPFHMVFVSPGFCGAFDVGQFKLKHPDVPCVAIVSSISQLSVVSAYNGYITVCSSVDEVSQAVLKARNVGGAKTQQVDTSMLSLREKEILVEIARGLSNKEIADKLNIAVYTVNTHRRNICQKLDIHSAAGLTVFAMANGLLDMGPNNL